jgi:Kef-type K+ transport system membrane component KefB
LAIITDVVVVILILVVIILHNLPLEGRTPVVRLGIPRYVVFVVFLFLILISIFLFILLCQHRDEDRESAPSKRTL